MRQVKVFARAIQLLSAVCGSLFAWALWYLLSNPRLTFDGPEPNSVAYYLDLDRFELLTLVSVGVFLILSCAGFLASFVPRKLNSRRLGVTAVLASVLIMAVLDWILEGVGRDLLTLDALGAFIAFSVWLLFFHRGVSAVFKTQRVPREPNPGGTRVA